MNKYKIQHQKSKVAQFQIYIVIIEAKLSHVLTCCLKSCSITQYLAYDQDRGSKSRNGSMAVFITKCIEMPQQGYLQGTSCTTHILKIGSHDTVSSAFINKGIEPWNVMPRQLQTIVSMGNKADIQHHGGFNIGCGLDLACSTRWIYE